MLKTHPIKRSIGSDKKMKLYSYKQPSSTKVSDTSLVHWIQQKPFSYIYIYTVQKVLQWFHYASW